MIDSHCHLDHEPLFSDLENVIQRSKEIGVKKLLTISTSIESFSRVKEIVRKISFLLYPIIPESSLKALKIFDIEEKDVKLDTVSNNEYLTKGNNIHKIDILFKKIEKQND